MLACFNGFAVEEDKVFSVGVFDDVGSVFKDCTSLSSVILPVGLRAIGYDAFSGCSALSRIAIPKALTEFEPDAFAYCDSLSEISFGGSREAWELLMHGGALTVEKTDGGVNTPRVVFLNLSDDGKKSE